MEALPILGELVVLKEILAWFRNETKPEMPEVKPNAPRFFDDKVGQMLVALGKKPEEVATSLHEQGICGQRRNVFACPISNLIAKLLREHVSEGDLYVCVSREGYTVNWIPPQSDKAVLLARGQLPRPVSELIWRFDGEDFPELEGQFDVSSHHSPY